MINPVQDFSNAQLQKLEKAYARFAPAEMEHGSEDLFIYINEKLFGNLSGDDNPSVLTIPLNELISLDRNEVAVQTPLNPSKVAALLVGEDNLLDIGLVNPIKIGLVDGQPYNEGGGHRAEAIRLIFDHYGFSDKFSEVNVPCFVMKGNATRIILDNVARGATKHERTLIHSSVKGINVTDTKDVYEAYLDKAFGNGTAASNLGEATRLLAIDYTNDKSAGLTPETRGTIGVALVNAIKKNHGIWQFGQDAFLDTVLNFMADHLEDAVKYVSKTTTLVARATTPIANYLYSQFTEAVVAGGIQLVEKPVKEPKVKTARPKATATQVEGEEPAPKKARKPRAKKVEEEVTQDAVPEHVPAFDSDLILT